ncbi:MAG: glycosyltransferase, partial [bacterium]
MTVNDKKSISIVVPVYNEEKGIASFHSSLIKVLNKIDIDFEIIYVDDGSSDNSLSIIKQINDNNIKVVVLSRN